MQLNLGIRRRLAPWLDRPQSSENSHAVEGRVLGRGLRETVCAIDRSPSLGLSGTQWVIAKTNHSVLNRMGRITAVRRLTPAFGSVRLSLYPANYRILSYVRQLGEETVLVVNHLSNAAQSV